jgi:hypothetical protein
MDKNLERYIIAGLVLILILLSLNGCVKPKMENQGPKQPTTLETVGKMKGIVNVLGCMFAPNSEECRSLKGEDTEAQENKEWEELDEENKM